MTPPRPPSGRQRPLHSERTEGSGSWDTLEWNKLNSQHTASGSSSTSFANLSCLLESERVIVEVSPESASQFGELVADPVTNELLHYTEKPETFVSDRINCCVYVFTPDIFTAIRLRDVSSQRKDTGKKQVTKILQHNVYVYIFKSPLILVPFSLVLAILRRVSSFEALQLATRLVCSNPDRVNDIVINREVVINFVANAPTAEQLDAVTI
ncbi:hypothetical protein YC2023_086859 [Brassica napus]